MSKKQIERIRATLYNLREARINEKEALNKIKEIIYNGNNNPNTSFWYRLIR